MREGLREGEGEGEADEEVNGVASGDKISCP